LTMPTASLSRGCDVASQHQRRKWRLKLEKVRH
jgi:hypothetical protein